MAGNKRRAKLENRLGASPRGFESLFLRQKKEIRTLVGRISFFLRFSKGFERVGRRLVTKGLYFTEKRADQTTDGTVVCNPGVIASVRKRK